MSMSEKRPGRRGVGAALLTVMALAALVTGCGGRTSVTPRPTATTVPPTATPAHPSGPVVTAPIDEITMLSATGGWGRVHHTSGSFDHQIAYTDDGGHTWYDVTPPGFVLKPQGSIQFYAPSATEAWVWPSSIGSAPGESTTLWHTSDAGAHWTSSIVASGAVTQLDFVDANHGWLTTTPYGSAAGQTLINVWRTTDGGSTWTSIASRPVQGHTTGISFVSATTGFATSAGFAIDPVHLITVTHDGGVSWSPVALPGLSGQVVISPPIFSSATAGILEATALESTSEMLKLYRTTDAGATWQPAPALSGADVTLGASIPCSALSTGDVFVAINVNGQITLDQLLPGAASWTAIKTQGSSQALLSGMTQLDFVNTMTGWALTSAGLIGTPDGGVTWATLHA